MASTYLPFLRTHSYYSFLESLLSPQDLVRCAAENGIRVLGLSDHQYLSGAISFYELCLQNKIKPVLGLEVDFVYQGNHGVLPLFAKNLEGWSNLSRISSYSLVQNRAIDIAFLEKYHEGLVCFLGDPRGVLTNMILSYPEATQLTGQFTNQIHQIFNKNLFIEIQRYDNGPLKSERELLRLSKEHQIPIIAGQNVFYRQKSDLSHFQTLTAIKHNTTISSLAWHHLPPGNAYFPNIDDFIKRYSDLPEAILGLEQIQELFDIQLPLKKANYPVFNTPGGESQMTYLRHRAYEGAKLKYKEITPEISQRLDHELEIISSLGYEPIFLIVEDVLNHARQLGIPTSSRGSAASSLVAHCLNITSPDPLALDLYFERFLNPARKKPPDIDTDIDSNRRDEVIQYVFKKYGADRVAMVSTINRYRPKSAFVDVAKAYGLPPEMIRKLSNKLPSSFRFHSGHFEEDPFSSLMRETTITNLGGMIADSRRILDHPRHLSVHPGGIVIAPFPMTDLVPLVHSDSLGLNHTQFDLENVEKLGLIKIDLLGIRGLTVLGEVANRVQSWHLTEYQDGIAVLDAIPKDDPGTSETISMAKTIGCFQIESPGMRATLKEIKAETPEDIMVALALYRPGPLRGGLRDAFVRRFRGEEPVSHLHPSLEPLLKDTLGVILYQEQVLRIAHELGGLSIAQADILRRAMSHFDPGDVMQTLKENFIEGAMQRKNVPPDAAEHIWELMAAFAGYGFPKAHAASYAQLAWNSTWCKTHFPAEFMAAVLGFSGGYYSQRVYLMEARRMNLKVSPPHINHSNHYFRVAYPSGEPVLYMGLNQVKDLMQKTIIKIINNRPFDSLEDFLVRVNPQKKEILNLIKCDAFKGIISIPEGLKYSKSNHTPGQLTLFTMQESQNEDWGLEEKIKAQQEILGISLESSPLEIYMEQLRSFDIISTLQALEINGERVKIAGMRQTMRRFKTQSNQWMCFLNLEDLEGSIQVVISPHLYQKHHKQLQAIGPFVIEGIIDNDIDKHCTRLRAEKIYLLTNSY
jgi:DNA-directed DNA polymerase III PolC